jgi:membrane protease YdiL (CAAX protease family)
MEELTANEYPVPNYNNPLPETEPIGPDNPPWNVLTAIAVWVISIILIVIMPNLFLLPYLYQQSLDLSNEQLLREFVDTDRIAIVLRIAAIIPAHILTLLLGWMVVTRLRKYSFRQTLGWTSGGIRWWHYLIILGGFYVTVASVGYFLPEQDNEMIRLLQSSRTAVYVIAFLATFSAPLVEEVVYRGILFPALQRGAGSVWAILIVTLLFAGVHFFQYWGSPGTIFLITFLSLGLTFLRYKTKSLLPCIILHTLINGLQSLFLVLGTLIPDQPPAALVHFIK